MEARIEEGTAWGEVSSVQRGTVNQINAAESRQTISCPFYPHVTKVSTIEETSFHHELPSTESHSDTSVSHYPPGV